MKKKTNQYTFIKDKLFNVDTGYISILLLLLVFTEIPVLGLSVKINSASVQNLDCTFKFDAESNMKIYNTVERQAEFPGGTGEMYRFFSKNAGLTNEDYERFGRLEIKFLIPPSGKGKFMGFANKNINSVKYLENRMKKLLGKMPRWTPAKCKGANVAVRYVFVIQS